MLLLVAVRSTMHRFTGLVVIY